MISFADLTKRVHMLNDMILTDMVCEDEATEEASSFSRHLLATKNWYSRISWANKKRYVLALLEDVRSAWALSLLLKSLWNCRPKDSVLSNMAQPVWTSYDEVPMDHNRTALPTTTLAQVMKSDRLWFLTLGPEAQAMVLSELLMIAGGPVMWTVLRRAQLLYDRYRNQQLRNLQECIVNDPSNEKAHPSPPDKSQKKPTGTSPKVSMGGTSDTGEKVELGPAEKELEANLAAWNATIKAMKDNLKLEEQEIISIDGTATKIWKVNRPKPEAIETVDFVQLLPSSIAKHILSFLPRQQLGDYARVNKYWAFLVDEFKAELAAVQKLNSDFDKLNKIMLCHDTTMEFFEKLDATVGPPSSLGNFSTALSLKIKPPPSIKASEKSWGAFSFRHFMTDKLTKGFTRVQIPIRNLAELSERLDQRGAADENLWTWCENILKKAKAKTNDNEGVLGLGLNYFPCPLMKKCLEVPLYPPLHKDPAKSRPLKPRRNITHAIEPHAPKEENVKRYRLWTRDFSGLYPVFKIPSYESPV